MAASSSDGRPGRHDGAGEHGHAGAGDDLLRPCLVAHHAHRLGRRADPRDAGPAAGLGEGGVLGKEAVSRVERVGARLLRRPYQRLGVQVGVAQGRPGQQHGGLALADVRAPRVVGRVDGDGLASGVVRAPDDPSRDFTPVGHEQASDRSRRHQCRTTPKTAVPRTGAECVAVSAMASTVRVSRGSMMPSSHNRPVAYWAVDSASIWFSVA